MVVKLINKKIKAFFATRGYSSICLLKCGARVILFIICGQNKNQLLARSLRNVETKILKQPVASTSITY